MQPRLYIACCSRVVSPLQLKYQPKQMFMRKLFLFSVMAACLLCNNGCVKSVGNDGLVRSGCKLPHNTAPAALRGDWASGFNSMTQIVDAYDGHFEGYTWESAKVFNFTADGTGAEFYYMAKGEYFQSATKAIGTITFDEGATEENGSFVFYACRAHYKGWGTTSVDRDATDEELQNSLTHRYYYAMQGNWLRIDPSSPPDDYSSSFEKVD
jgi:hypothetical protein